MTKILLCMFSVVFFGVSAQAQEMDTKKERKRIKNEQNQMKQLGLNDNQGQELKRINARYRDQHKAIMKNESLSQEQKQVQAKALNDRRVADIHTAIGQDKAQEWNRYQQQEKEKGQGQENKGQQKKAQKPEKANKGKKG